MPSSYTSLLKFAKPGLGDTGWGTTVNGGFTDMVEQALTGYVQKAVTVAGPNTIPTIADGASSDGRNQFIELTGTLASPATLTVPAGTLVGSAGNNKLYFIKNSAGDAVTITTGGANTVVVPNGKSMMLRVTNTGVEVVADQFVNLNASGNVTVAGTTTLAALTASGNVTVAGTTTLAALTASGNVSFDGGTFVFNESGADKDARFEGDTDANLLFLDASTDRVGIGTSTPVGKIDSVSNATAAFVARASTTGANQTVDALTAFNSDASLYALARYNAVQHIWQYAGTTEGMRLDASGNLGIGTATPGARLAVDSGSAALAANFNSSNAGGVYTRFQNSGTSIGDLGAAASALSSGVAGDFAITSRSGNLVFGTGTNERMRLTNSGELLVATTNTNFSTSDGIRFIPTGSASASFVAFTNGGNGGTNLALVNSNGSTAIWNAIVFQFNTTAVGSIACTPTTTAYNQSSDRRLKTAVAPAADAGALLDAVQVVEFDWKVGGHVRYGVIAQDLHLIAPEVVTPGDSNEEVERPWGVDYSKLVPMLIKEVQSLRARVAALEAK